MSATCPARRATNALKTLVIVLIGLLSLAQRSGAQTMPLLPDPITTPDLWRYAEILGLSDQQKLGLLTVHDAYKARYREFDNKDVRKLLDQLVDIGFRFQRNGFAIPERKELEGVIDDYKKLLSGAQGIDREFFNQLSVSLSEDQIARLQQARNTRELAVFRVMVAEMARGINPGAAIDMVELLRPIDLAPDEREQVDPALDQYTASLLGKTRELFVNLTKAATIVLDTIDQLGLRNMTPEQMFATMQDEKTTASLTAMFDEASKPMQLQAFEMSQLNLQTFRRIEAALKPEHATALRDAYLRQAYGEAYTGLGQWTYRYADALLLDELSAAQVAEISAQRDVIAGQERGMIDPVANDLEESRKYRTIKQLQQRWPETLGEKLDELPKRREALSASAITTLEGILGPDLAANFDEKVKARKQRIEEQRAAEQLARAATGPVREDETLARDSRSEAFSPDPISHSQMVHMSGRLALDEGDRAVLGSIFDDYRTEFAAVLERPLTAVVAPDAGGEPTPQAKPTSADECKAKLARFELLVALDAAFFENAAAITNDPRRQRLIRLHGQIRRRDVLNRTALMAASIYNENSRWGESWADPVTAALDASLDAAGIDALIPVIESYESQVMPQMTDRFNTAFEAFKQSAALEAMRDRDNKKAMEFVRQKRTDLVKQATSVTSDINKLNRTTLDEMTQKLPADSAWSLRLTYNRAAYPDLFEAELVMSRMIDRVLALPGLGGDQREQIQAIATDFRTEYLAIADRMIDVRRNRTAFVSRGMPTKQDINREIDGQRMQFDQTEACSRARLRMRLTLRPEQLQAVPELTRDHQTD